MKRQATKVWGWVMLGMLFLGGVPLLVILDYLSDITLWLLVPVAAIVAGVVWEGYHDFPHLPGPLSKQPTVEKPKEQKENSFGEKDSCRRSGSSDHSPETTGRHHYYSKACGNDMMKRQATRVWGWILVGVLVLGGTPLFVVADYLGSISLWLLILVVPLIAGIAWEGYHDFPHLPGGDRNDRRKERAERSPPRHLRDSDK